MSKHLIDVANFSILKQTFVLVEVLAIFCVQNRVYAQIIPDNTLGSENSIVIPNVTIKDETGDRIDGGAIRGANLFHSFQQFNVGDGQRVYFANPTGIENILSRVTSKDISNILGTLGVNGNANLFLLNPNGIIFGENAKLDVGGSFVGSTASAIQFGDNTQFSANTSQSSPLLTVSIPIGLQFGGNAESIEIQGNGRGLRSTTELIDTNFGLRVQPDRTLALVGGNLNLEGATLKTAGGRIELGSVAGSGLVSLTPIDSGFALGYSNIPTFGDIQLSGGATVDASGIGGGEIQVRGGRLILRDGSQFEASTLGTEPGKTLNVNASESIEIIGATPDGESFSGFLAKVYRGATGTGGKLTVKTEQLTLRDGLISTSVEEEAIGNGGNLTVETGRLIVRDGAQILANTFGKGDAGNLTVSADKSVDVVGETADNLFSSALQTASEEGATGNGGNLTVKTRRLIVRDGAMISSGALGEGDGGNLTISAGDSLELIGRTADNQFASGLFTSVNRRASGNAGNLNVETGRLIVRDGAVIQASALGKGVAGNLTLSARSIELDNQGSISTAATSGNGGNITLQLQDLLLLRRNSRIFSTGGIARAGGDGGNITIDTPFIVAFPSENSDITANAFTGRGGRVTIDAQAIFGTQFRPQLTPKSDLTASSEFGLSGIVEINTPDFDPSQQQIELPTDIVNVAGLINQNLCRVGQGSEFILTGRGGLPNSPKDLLNAEASWEDWRITSEKTDSLPKNSARSNLSKNLNNKHRKIVEAQGWKTTSNGKIILTAEPFGVTSENLRSPLALRFAQLRSVEGVQSPSFDCQTLREK
jgi:filamentous hemagglutinin family protein